MAWNAHWVLLDERWFWRHLLEIKCLKSEVAYVAGACTVVLQAQCMAALEVTHTCHVHSKTASCSIVVTGTTDIICAGTGLIGAGSSQEYVSLARDNAGADKCDTAKQPVPHSNHQSICGIQLTLRQECSLSEF